MQPNARRRLCGAAYRGTYHCRIGPSGALGDLVPYCLTLALSPARCHPQFSTRYHPLGGLVKNYFQNRILSYRVTYGHLSALRGVAMFSMTWPQTLHSGFLRVSWKA